MDESSVQSQKGKDKAEMSRAVWSDNMKKIVIDLCIVEVLRGGRPGSNLRTQSWTRVIEGFKEKTGISYGQKQLKNQWDGMRKQYNVWTTLCGQTGVGLNEATQTITMDPERWDEYLKGHPEAKIFRTRPLSFSNEMGILFGGTQATGEEAWTPSSGSFPEDLNTQMPSPSPPPHIENTHNHVQEETFEDILTEEVMTNARRKRPCPSRSRRDVRNNKIDEKIERLVIILEEDKKDEEKNEEEHKEEERKEEVRKEEERKKEEEKRGPTMQDCIDILKQMPNIQVTSELYFFGTRAFKDKDNRDIFMSFESNDARFYWLNMIVKHGPS